MTHTVVVRIRGRASEILRAAATYQHLDDIYTFQPHVWVADGASKTRTMKTLPPISGGDAKNTLAEIKYVERRLSDGALANLYEAVKSAAKLCASMNTQRLKQVFARASSLLGQQGAKDWLDEKPRFAGAARRQQLLDGAHTTHFMRDLDEIEREIQDALALRRKRDG